ncbi:MAG: hypothetical protein PHR83_15100 [Paludibacter sp.]|nr:hypothetical protein [Paludibacter sp.]
MKTSKYILSLVLLGIGSVLTVQADDSIVNRNVTVEREYKPIIHDAGKINSVPKVLELNVDKAAANYSDFNLPLNAGFNIHTLPAAQLDFGKKADNKPGYARVGIGNYFNTLADFAYPLVRTSDMHLDFSLNHLGAYGIKAHTTTKAALSFDKSFAEFNLYAGLGGGHEYLKYYADNFNNNGTVVDLKTLAIANGTDTYREEDLTHLNRTAKDFSLSQLANDSIGNIFWRFNALAGVRSLPESDELRYRAEVQYKVFSSHYGLSEHLIHTQAGFNIPSKENRMGLDVEMYNLSYRSDNLLMNYFNTAYTVVTLNPYYGIERENYNVRLGLKTGLSFGRGDFFNPSADIRAEWKVAPEFFSVYGGAAGGYAVNTLDAMADENRYLYSDTKVNDTYTPYDVYAGFKLKPLYNLLLDAFVDYCSINNQYFFVNKEYSISTMTVPPVVPTSGLFTNRFNVIYSDATQFKVGARANYNFKNLVNVELKGAYNGWAVATEQYAWNKPKWEASLNTGVRINSEWSVSANAFYEGERYAKLGNLAPILMRDKIDINLGANYSYNNWLSAFVKVNNLINNHYQDFYGYYVQGFNVLVGAGFSF